MNVVYTVVGVVGGTDESMSQVLKKEEKKKSYIREPLTIPPKPLSPNPGTASRRSGHVLHLKGAFESQFFFCTRVSTAFK